MSGRSGKRTKRTNRILRSVTAPPESEKRGLEQIARAEAERLRASQERWAHGWQIESDYVCPAGEELLSAMAQLDEARAALAEAKLDSEQYHRESLKMQEVLTATMAEVAALRSLLDGSARAARAQTECVHRVEARRDALLAALDRMMPMIDARPLVDLDECCAAVDAVLAAMAAMKKP